VDFKWNGPKVIQQLKYTPKLQHELNCSPFSFVSVRQNHFEKSLIKFFLSKFSTRGYILFLKLLGMLAHALSQMPLKTLPKSTKKGQTT
jgi:hypothetical protein